MLSKHNRRTKIIWSFDLENLSAVTGKMTAEQDFECIRIVYEGGSLSSLQDKLVSVKSYKNRHNESVSIMVDLNPKARGVISDCGSVVDLPFGEKLRLSLPTKGGDVEIECNNFKGFFKEGELVYFGYGNVLARVETLDEEICVCSIEKGGTLFNGMEIHVPATRQTSNLSEYTNEEFEFIEKAGVDFLLLPSISSSSEMSQLPKTYSNDSAPWLIAKINSSHSLKNYKDYIDKVKGVCISRMELAMFTDPAVIPIRAKEIIGYCNEHAKLAIVASEILGSMRQNITPTRAEVSDIANAVFDGADGVVSSEDVAYGNFKGESVEVLHKAISDAESHSNVKTNWKKLTPIITNEMDAIAFGAYKAAKRVDAKAIVCLTKTGNTALKLASFDTPTPIIAVTFDPLLLGKLALVRGVSGIVLDGNPSIDEILPRINQLLEKSSWLKSGDRFIFVTVTLSSLSHNESNLMTVQTLP